MCFNVDLPLLWNATFCYDCDFVHLTIFGLDEMAQKWLSRGNRPLDKPKLSNCPFRSPFLLLPWKEKNGNIETCIDENSGTIDEITN